MRLWLLMMVVCGQLAGALFQSVPQELRGAVEAIERVPEVQALMREVERDGGVRLSVRSSGDFQAYWEGGRRTIVLNTRLKRSEGSLISSIVFELCNAARNRELRVLWQRARWGQIGREAFVREVERIEFENLSRAAAVLRVGRQRGLLPCDARQWAPIDFERYLHSQRGCGHSAYLGRQYDRFGARA